MNNIYPPLNHLDTMLIGTIKHMSDQTTQPDPRVHSSREVLDLWMATRWCPLDS